MKRDAAVEYRHAQRAVWPRIMDIALADAAGTTYPPPRASGRAPPHSTGPVPHDTALVKDARHDERKLLACRERNVHPAYAHSHGAEGRLFQGDLLSNIGRVPPRDPPVRLVSGVKVVAIVPPAGRVDQGEVQVMDKRHNPRRITCRVCPHKRRPEATTRARHVEAPGEQLASLDDGTVDGVHAEGRVGEAQRGREIEQPIPVLIRRPQPLLPVPVVNHCVPVPRLVSHCPPPMDHGALDEGRASREPILRTLHPPLVPPLLVVLPHCRCRPRAVRRRHARPAHLQHSPSHRVRKVPALI